MFTINLESIYVRYFVDVIKNAGRLQKGAVSLQKIPESEILSGKSRDYITSKTKLSTSLVNSFQPLTSAVKSSITDARSKTLPRQLGVKSIALIYIHFNAQRFGRKNSVLFTQFVHLIKHYSMQWYCR